MNVVVFGSGSGTNLEAILRAQKQSKSPSYAIQALFTDRRCRLLDIGQRESIPVIYYSFVNFFKKQNCQNAQDPNLRHLYDREVAALLQECAYKNGISIDLIVLAGYMRLLSPTFLELFPNKVINVHPADLTKLDDRGLRKYVGADAVYDALMQGETQTRSSVILVDKDVDAGPLLVSGPWIEYAEGYPVTKEKAQLHQNKQKELSDWPACISAVEMIAEGRLGLDKEGNVFVDRSYVHSK